MFLYLAVDSKQSLERTLNLNFLFATFKRVEEDISCQMFTLVQNVNQKYHLSSLIEKNDVMSCMCVVTATNGKCV